MEWQAMTLNEAIEHCGHIAETCSDVNCANEHLQLAEWLNELKWFRINERPIAKWINDEHETGEGSNTWQCVYCGTVQTFIDGSPKEAYEIWKEAHNNRWDVLNAYLYDPKTED